MIFCCDFCSQKIFLGENTRSKDVSLLLPYYENNTEVRETRMVLCPDCKRKLANFVSKHRYEFVWQLKN